MRYVERGLDGKVKGSFAGAQPGYAEELLADNHPDLVEYLNPTPTPAQVKDKANAPILAQMAAANLAIISALTEGDTPRLAAHRAAQALLRAQLLP